MAKRPGIFKQFNEVQTDPLSLFIKKILSITKVT
jgi:hypothetical protein